MDSTDKKILKILQENARCTMKEIGSRVGLSSPAVRARIDSLEAMGVITGYHAEVDAKKIGKNIEAFVGTNIRPEKQKEFLELCSQSRCVVSHYRVIGPHNALLHVVAEDNSELEQLIDALKKLGTTVTSMVLSIPFKRKTIE